MPRARQREKQEGDRAEHEPPLPCRTREEDRGKISQQRIEAQKDQEFVVLMAFPSMFTGADLHPMSKSVLAQRLYSINKVSPFAVMLTKQILVLAVVTSRDHNIDIPLLSLFVVYKGCVCS